jgi:hypothetical protein
MKKRISAFLLVAVLSVSGTAFCAETIPSFENQVKYFAGISMLMTDAKSSRPQKAERYRRLCLLTGVSGQQAKAFVLRYKADPEGWQKFMAAVHEILKKKE